MIYRLRLARSSAGSPARFFFGCCAMRARMSHALRLPASETMSVIGLFSLAGSTASGTTGCEFAGRARASGLRFSASSLQLCPRRHPARLTSRSSRPHIVASTSCFALRLHAVAAPLWVGLTLALGGEKRSVVVLFAAVIHRLRLACSSDVFSALCHFGYIRYALTNRMRHVHRLRNLRFLSFGFVAPDAVASETSG